MAFDMEALIQETKDIRLKHLEEQAMHSLKVSVRKNAAALASGAIPWTDDCFFRQAENFDNVVFPNACIAGDCVITHLLDRLDLLKNGKVKIMVVDTFHLFDETMCVVPPRHSCALSCIWNSICMLDCCSDTTKPLSVQALRR